MKPIIVLFFTIFSLYTTSAFAESKAFVGLEWGATKDWRPNLVLGYKDVQIEKDTVKGWGAAISLGWDGFDRIKMTRLRGSQSTQLEAGVGYSASGGAPFVTIGAQGRHLFADMDFVFNGDINGHIGVNTIKNFKP